MKAHTHVLSEERRRVAVDEIVSRLRLAHDAYAAYCRERKAQDAGFHGDEAARAAAHDMAGAGYGFVLDGLVNLELADLAELKQLAREKARRAAQAQEPARPPVQSPGPAGAPPPSAPAPPASAAVAPTAPTASSASPPAASAGGPPAPASGPEWFLVIVFAPRSTPEFMAQHGYRKLANGSAYDKKVPADRVAAERAWAKERSERVEVKPTSPPEGKA